MSTLTRKLEDGPSAYAPRSSPSIQAQDPEVFDEPKRNRLNEIAALVNRLTYGEMIELAEALWKLRPATPPSMSMSMCIEENDMPGIWHRWSQGRK